MGHALRFILPLSRGRWPRRGRRGGDACDVSRCHGPPPQPRTGVRGSSPIKGEHNDPVPLSFPVLIFVLVPHFIVLRFKRSTHAMRPGLWTLRSAKKGDETIETGRQRGRFAQGSVQGLMQGSAKTLAGDPQATLKAPSTTLKHVCMNPQTTLKRPSGTLGSGDCQAAIPAGAQKRILMGCGAALYRSAQRFDTVNQTPTRLCLCPRKQGEIARGALMRAAASRP